jgi:surfactin synthase thioesterase subunit
MSEPLRTTLAGVLDAVAGEVLARAGHPFAFFGHSMGAIVAFELAHQLQSRGAELPAVVFASGAQAPSRRDPERFAKLQSDAELVAELERLRGTPASVLADAELMQLTLPVLRADFQVLHGYACAAERQIRCPIEVMAGRTDDATPESLAAWRAHTEGDFFLNVLPGGHFFIHERIDEVSSLVQRRLATLLAADAGPRPRAATRLQTGSWERR